MRDASTRRTPRAQAARVCGPAAPPNCVNPPLAGSRSLAAVILLPRFFSVPNLKAFCTDFVPSNVPRRAAPRFPAPFALCAAVCAFKGWGGGCTRQSPLKRVLRRLWAMCEKTQRILLRRWKTEPLGMDFPSRSCPVSEVFAPYLPVRLWNRPAIICQAEISFGI